MFQKGWLLLLFSTLFINSLAQNIFVTGKVTDNKKGLPIDGTIVTLTSLQDSASVLGYAITNLKGDYKITLTSVGKYTVKVAMMNYVTQQVVKQIEQTLTINFQLEEKTTVLKEVLVKPPRITQRNDTLSYKVDAFASTTDRTIGDIIKKLPGVEIANDGTILYNGKAINKFYIEGLDLLADKYSLAVNGISYKDINSVEVLENHQSIKALKPTVATDRAALNLRMKDSAKGKWLGNIEAAAGAKPLLWKAEGLAMRIAQKSQSLNVLKTNNTGKNVSADLKSHTLEDLINGLENRIDVSSFLDIDFNPPSIAENRFYFNRSLLSSTNNIKKLKKDFELKSNMSYSYDYLDNSQNKQTIYLTPQGNLPLVINENQSHIRNNQKLEGMINLNKNVDNYYLNNAFSAQMLYDKTKINTEGTQENKQTGTLPSYYLENNFNLIKLLNKKTLKFNVYSRFDYLPQSLSVVYNNVAPAAFQNLRQNSFFNHANVSLGAGANRLHLDHTLGLKVRLQSIHSDLQNPDNFIPISNKLINNLRWNAWEYYYKTTFNYKTEKTSISVSLPLSYNQTVSNNKQAQQKEIKKPLFFNPTANLLYKLSPLWALSANAAFRSNLEDVNGMNGAYILTNYRNIILGNNEITSQFQQSYSAGVSYRNPVKSLFSNFSTSYILTSSEKLIDNIFYTTFIASNKLIYRNPAAIFRLSARLSKGIDVWKSTAGFGINYSKTNRQLMQVGQLLKNDIRNFQLTPQFNGSPAKWITINYEGVFSMSRLQATGFTNTNPVWQTNNKLQFSFNFNDDLSVQMGGEHYYNQLSNKTTFNTFFVDFSMRYLLSKSVELSIEGRNIFNNKQYGYTLFSSESITTNYYAIRPLNVLAGIYYRW